MKKIIYSLFIYVICIYSLLSINVFLVSANDSLDSIELQKFYSSKATSSLNDDIEYISIAGNTIKVQSTYTLTPNNSKVPVYNVLDDLSSILITLTNISVDSSFSEATRLSSATAKYNCHSYAWYSNSTDNTYWMNTPELYYKDGSYDEVATPRGGDIICYFDNNGTENDYSDE